MIDDRTDVSLFDLSLSSELKGTFPSAFGSSPNFYSNDSFLFENIYQILKPICEGHGNFFVRYRCI